MLFDKYLDLKKEEPNPMFFSSFLFLTNVLIAYNYNYFLYSILFFGLFISSIIVHSNDTPLTNLIDKISIVTVVSYGGYMFISKRPSLIKTIPIVLMFLGVIYIYMYGYYTNSFCFHEDKLTSRTYHLLMHLISSVGHHIIMLI